MSTAAREAQAALLPYRPGVDGPWDQRHAGQLVRRTCFGGTLEQRARVLDLGPAQAAITLTESPPIAGEYAATLAALEPLASVDSLPVAQSIWLTRMLRDPHPFREVLALFWHGHFATSVAKVGRVRLLARQVELFREQGAGPFGALVEAVSRDPAMIVWLDGNGNRRHHPNENYARELMELFTLGRGHYAESDVLDAARAFTGWHEHGERFRFNAHEHDEGDKRVLGRAGNLDGGDVVAACLEQPACGRHVGGALFRSFVRPDPEPELLAVVGERYRAGGYDTLALVRLLLSSRAFYDPRARRAVIKSPVALAAGAARSLGLRPDTTALAERLSTLGQSLYSPPSVKGWDGGMSWVNAALLIGRLNLGAELARVAEAGAAPAIPESLAGLLDLLLEGELPDGARDQLLAAGASRGDRLQAVVSLPEYQLA